MRDLEFKKAYLNIIKEGSFDVPAEVTVPAETETDEAPATAELKKVCFVTTDAKLIDALNSGFEEVVIFTNAKDEATGEDTVIEVKFGKDSFGNVEITDVEEDDVANECGDVTGEDDEMATEEDETVTEDDDMATEEDETVTEDDDMATEEDLTEEDVDPSEWVEDGVCVKCGSADCKGDCKCEKCGEVNCIGDCE